MAQFNDLLVNGSTRFVGSAYGNLNGYVTSAISAKYAVKTLSSLNAYTAYEALTQANSAKIVSNGVYWENGTANTARPIACSTDDYTETKTYGYMSKTKYSNDFTYNPNTKILTTTKIASDVLKCKPMLGGTLNTDVWHDTVTKGAFAVCLAQTASQTANINVSDLTGRNGIPLYIFATYANAEQYKTIIITNDTSNTVTSLGGSNGASTGTINSLTGTLTFYLGKYNSNPSRHSCVLGMEDSTNLSIAFFGE